MPPFRLQELPIKGGVLNKRFFAAAWQNIINKNKWIVQEKEGPMAGDPKRTSKNESGIVDHYLPKQLRMNIVKQ